MISKLRKRLAAAAVSTAVGAAAILGSNSVVSAAVIYYWDSDGSTLGGSSGTTATGTWGTNNFWNTDSAGGAGTFVTTMTNADTAVFAAGTDVTGGYTVTLSTTTVASGIQFDEGAVTITSSTLNLGGTGSVNGLIFNGSGANVIQSNIAIQTAQTWTNNSSATQTISGTVTASTRALTIDGSGNTTISGGFSSSTALTKNGGGTFTLAGTSTTSGTAAGNAININAGNFTLAATGSLTGGGQNAVFTVGVNGSATINGALSGYGQFTVNGTLTASANVTVPSVSNLQIGGTMTMTAGTLALSRGNGGSLGSINNGGSLLLQGSSILSIGGNSSASFTIASGGVLDVGPSATSSGIAALFVQGTLRGSGTVGLTTVASGGHLAPGTNNIGTLSISAAPTLSAGSVIDLDLGTAGASHASVGTSDRVAVTGALALTSTSLTLNDNAGANGQGSAGGGSYKVFTYTTGTSAGTLPSVTNNIPNTHHKLTDGGSADRSVYVDLFTFAASSLPTTVTLPAVRVGGTFGTQAVAISNTGTGGANFTEGLNATAGTPTGSASGNGGSFTDLRVGAGSNSSIVVGLSGSTYTGAAGAVTGTVPVALASNGTIDGYSNTALTGQNITVNGGVYDYAKPGFSHASGVGSLTTNAGTASSPYPAYNTSYTLAMGSFANGSGIQTATLNLANILIGSSASYQDLLNGSYIITGSGAFGGWSSFSDIAAAASQGSLNVTFDTSYAAATYNATLTFTPTSKNGPSMGNLGNTNMTDIVIALSGTITSSGTTATTYTLDAAAANLSLLKGGTTALTTTLTNTGTGSADTLNYTNIGASITGGTGSGSLSGSGTNSGGPLANGGGSASNTLQSLTGTGYGTVVLTGAGTISSPSTTPTGTPTGSTVNVGNATAATGNAIHNHQTTGTPLTAPVSSGNNYGTLSSIETNALGNEAILIGNAATANTTVAMSWRSRNADEIPGTFTSPPLLDPSTLISDAVAITGFASDTVIVKVSYDPSLLANESLAISNGLIRLMWLDPMGDGYDDGTGSINDQWKMASLGLGTFTYKGDAVPSLSYDTLGSYGVDTSGSTHYAWAVVDREGQFAVVPEPATLTIAGLGIAGLLLRRRR